MKYNKLNTGFKKINKQLNIKTILIILRKKIKKFMIYYTKIHNSQV